MNEPFGFEIDGRLYEIVMPEEFTQDECHLFYETTGWPVEEMWIDELPFSDCLKREGFVTALTSIAYRRGNPDAAGEDVRVVIGATNRLQLLASLFRSLMPQEDENPKAEGTTSVPNESSKSSSDEKPSTPPPEDGISGSSSETSSDTPGAPTGTGESDGQSTPLPLRQVV